MFRISNDTQRAKTVTAIEGLKKQKNNIEKKKGKKIADLFEKGYRRMVTEFEAQIMKYDELRKELPLFQGNSLSDLGAYLVDARIAAGMTQEELAKKLGVSQPMIFKYEMNEYQGYSIGIIGKAIEALGLKVSLNAWRESEGKDAA